MTKTTDPVDAGCELEQMQRDIALKKHLERPKKRSTGVCIDCDGVIPVGRLNVNPYALRCIECQQMHELKKKQGVPFA